MAGMNGSEQLRATGLKRSFQVGQRTIEVLHDASIFVRKGEAVFLTGPSGAGKSTLMYTLAGLEAPEAGEVWFEETQLYHGPEWKRAALRNEKMGFVFQSFFLLPELTAIENVTLPALIGGRDASAHAATLLERVGLAERHHHLPTELSGGEQQRVAIARALINDPAILFADEPTGNLDETNSRQVVDLLLALSRENGRTLLVVTHDSHLAELGDRRLELRGGMLVE